MRHAWAFAVLGALLGAIALGCSTTQKVGDGLSTGADSGSEDSGVWDVSFGTDGGTVPTDGGGHVIGAPDAVVSSVLELSPDAATINVVLGIGQTIPTQQFSATIGGSSVSVAWTVSEGQIGSVSGSGLFIPAAGTVPTAVGGATMITASNGSQTATAKVTVNISEARSGDPSPSDAGVDSSGGYAGVGGDGVGDAATDAQISALNASPIADAGIALLYPYDQTVFPQGILAPLVQWDVGSHVGSGSIVAMKMQLTEAAYNFTGYFAIQPGVASFKNQVVPQSVWETLTYSNAGEAVQVSLTFLDASGLTWGPVNETWWVAQGTLQGTIYYNSYGTSLVRQSQLPDSGVWFGGATLGIKPGAAAPSLVAGSNVECRVCHVVSANGSTLFTQRGEPTSYPYTSAYALTPDASTENMFDGGINNSGQFAWPALYPDGTLLFSNSGNITAGDETPSTLYVGLSPGGPPPGTPVESSGLNGLGAMTPSFSPNGLHIAFNFFSGPLGDAGSGDSHTLGVIDLVVSDAGGDARTYTFENGRALWTPSGSDSTGLGAFYPSYLPTNDGVVVENLTQYNTRDIGGTRATVDDNDTDTLDGAHGELWWVDVTTGTATRLDRANGFDTDAGIAYLPPHASFSPDPVGGDVNFNYEPTVNPVPSGGYAWVIFTSRRLYGNVATANPFWSDPRYEAQILTTPTPKKLWVAAVDLNPTPGTDPSHPAFYLPGQELMAGNSRGYWVVSPCQANGTSCESGDECCGGYCASASDASGLTCTAVPPACASEGDSCSATTPCCTGAQSLQCISGRCAVPTPPGPQ